MKFLAMHTTNQKLRFDIFTVQNIFMEHDLYSQCFSTRLHTQSFLVTQFLNAVTQTVETHQICKTKH